MDFELELIGAVLRQQDTYLVATLRGVTDKEFETPSGKVGWKFIAEHLSTYGTVPSREFFTLKTGIDPPANPAERDDVLIAELLERALWNQLRAMDETIGPLVDARKPYEALEELSGMVRKLYNDGLSKTKLVEIASVGRQVLASYERAKSGLTGILSPWKAMNDITLGWQPGDFVVFVARMGVGKCVDADTEIPDPDTGCYRTIRDVVRRRSAVYTRSSYGEFYPVMPDLHIATGRKSCLRIETQSGLSIVATPEHPFSVVGGWVRADELCVGSHVETVKTLPEPRNADDSQDADHVLLVAAMLAEGGLTTNSPKFSNDDPAIVKVVRRVARSVGCDLVKHKGMNRSTWSASKKEHRFDGTVPNAIREILSNWGIGFEKSIDKKIPDRVFGLSNRLLAQFIGMYWSCDGSVEASNKLTVSSGSERVIRQMKRLLLRFGITSRVREKSATCNDKEFSAWEISVHASCLGLFKKYIPLVGEKKRLLSSARDGKNPNVDNVPLTPWLREKLFEIVKKGRSRGIFLKHVAARRGWTSCFSLHSIFQYECVSKSMLLDIADVYNNDSLRALCVPHWDKVVSVSPAGERDVYDLTVIGPHCFVANDIVAHNTFCMLMLAMAAWKAQKRVLFVGTEMTAMKLAMRLYSLHAKLPYQEFKHGRLDAFAEKRFKENVALLENATGFQVFGNDFDAQLNSIYAVVDLISPDIVFVDGLYLVKNEIKDRHSRVSHTADELKRLALRKGIPIITSTQFNREVSSNSRTNVDASKIGITDVIGWDADVIFGLYQTEDMKEDSMMGFRPMKLREGGGKDFFTHWDFETMTFDQVEDAKGAQGYADKDYNALVDGDVDEAAGDTGDGQESLF